MFIHLFIWYGIYTYICTDPALGLHHKPKAAGPNHAFSCISAAPGRLLEPIAPGGRRHRGASPFYIVSLLCRSKRSKWSSFWKGSTTHQFMVWTILDPSSPPGLSHFHHLSPSFTQPRSQRIALLHRHFPLRVAGSFPGSSLRPGVRVAVPSIIY